MSATILSAETADTVVIKEQSRDGNFFQFERIDTPAIDDSAQRGVWAVVRGTPDPNAGALSVLNDGNIPRSEDSPRENFFFAPGTQGGCIALDLGKPTNVANLTTYSWHPTSRGPQVFTLYGSAGTLANFSWNQLGPNTSITEAGWTKLATIDTRTSNRTGGQHASQVTNPNGSLGQYRYFLFEIQTTDSRDPFGNTFFSEIDVVAEGDTTLQRIAIPKPQTIRFSSPDELYEYTIDTTAAPELAQWSETELKPVILEWYPRIVRLLPSDGFRAPNKILFRYLPSERMEGIPAYAQGATISMNAGWMAREKKREARGAVVHEMVHVVQSYYKRERGSRRTPPPGWIVEGIPDYIRWFLYEPESKGAVLSKQARANAKHDASYRVTANFLDWVIRTHDTQGDLLQKLNAAAREGRFSPPLWKELTGLTEQELADAWRRE